MRIIQLCVVLSLVVCPFVNADSPNSLSLQEKEAGFALLFNGKNLDGWQQSGNWIVKDGTIAWKERGGSLVYGVHKIPDDFELRFEWKVADGSNSGIYYRPTQYEYQILDNTLHADGKNPRTSAASLYFCLQPSEDATKPVGQWNNGRIVCQGTVVQHWLNGKKVVGFDYTDPRWKSNVDMLTARGGDLAARGANLSLQDHGDPVWYRSIRIRKLSVADQIDRSPVTPAAISKEVLEAERLKLEGILKRRAAAEKRKANKKTTTTPKQKSKENLPNVILLMGDDHGWDETGYNGHPHLKTPVLDEMAATGLRMDRFYSAHPSCSPTRGSVMTGRHPVRYGTFSPNYSLRPEEITIAQLLSKSGFTCGHFGKWHLGPVKAASPTSPGSMGFDEWLSHDNFFELNPTFSRNGGPPQKFEGESSEIVIAETIEFLKKARQKKQPFFAVVWFGSPHEPYSGLEKDLALYDDLPKEYADKEVKLTSNQSGRSIKRPLRDVLRERYAEITAMDRSIGQLRDWLDQEKLRDDTLLWYCGDNGTPGDGIVTSPFRGRKGTMYEGGIRVPSIIEWPSRITKPIISDVNSVTSDMLPTLCKLTGTPLPDRPLDGIDLTSMIAGKMSKRPGSIGFWSFDSKDSKNEPYIDAELQRGTTPLVKLMGDIPTRNFRNFHHPEITEQDFAGSRVLLGNRYKLVVQNKRGADPKSELFDVRKDPAETNNLMETKPDVAAAMQQELKNWQQSVLKSLTAADYK